MISRAADMLDRCVVYRLVDPGSMELTAWLEVKRHGTSLDTVQIKTLNETATLSYD